MIETQLIAKPSFDEDITAKIESLGEITSNISKVKEYAKSLNDYYKNIIFTDESITIAKDEKKKVNKFKNEIAQYRKDIINQFNEPIRKFEQLGKETELILKDTYDTINNQVIVYENKQKELKEQEIREFFEEYKISRKVDFIEFEQANINVTLSASVKSLKEQAKLFIDKIFDDVQLINLEEYKEEILVEYKQTLNISKSIITVKNRKAMIEEQKRINEELKKEEDLLKENFSHFPKQEETILQAPKIESSTEEKLFTTTFTVRATKEKLKLLREYMELNKIERL